MKTNIKIEDLKDYIGCGIAGNFAHHLDQAGEANDFINVKVKEAHAPKGIFPFYLPNIRDNFLSEFPLSDDIIIHPRTQDGNLQLEPEVGLICKLIYDNDKVIDITPKYFCAYNDCTIRKDGATKISQKKNWGQNTKGISTQWIELDCFTKDSIIDSYHIASFIKREINTEKILYEYGEDSPVNTYNYIYDKLLDWIIEKINNQENINPLEDISSYINQINNPSELIISIGATSYTKYGENTFLEIGDEIFVVVYDNNKYTKDDIKKFAKEYKVNDELEFASILYQKVV